MVAPWRVQGADDRTVAQVAPWRRGGCRKFLALYSKETAKPGAVSSAPGAGDNQKTVDSMF